MRLISLAGNQLVIVVVSRARARALDAYIRVLHDDSAGQRDSSARAQTAMR